MAVDAGVTSQPGSGVGTADATPVSISVAVCTHDRTETLRRALASLVRQTTPPAEILVIDNAPSDDATRLLVHDEFSSVRYVLEPVAGLDFARNRALLEATMRCFAARPGLGACTGHVAALGTGSEGERLFEANGGFARGTHPIHLSAANADGSSPSRVPMIARSIGVGSGCSMAVRRRLVLDLGGFDEALDLGEALPGGGDLDILWRILDAGNDVRYEPAVRARHEHRADAASAVRQICGHNRALVAWLTKCAVLARGRKRLEIVGFLLWRLMKPGVRLVRRAAGRDALPAPVLLRLWAACWRGLGSYPPARRLAERRRTAADSPRGEASGTPC
jgi:GT2 family glycosyltransferase